MPAGIPAESQRVGVVCLTRKSSPPAARICPGPHQRSQHTNCSPAVETHRAVIRIHAAVESIRNQLDRSSYPAPALAPVAGYPLASLPAPVLPEPHGEQSNIRPCSPSPPIRPGAPSATLPSASVPAWSLRNPRSRGRFRPPSAHTPSDVRFRYRSQLPAGVWPAVRPVAFYQRQRPRWFFSAASSWYPPFRTHTAQVGQIRNLA